MEKINPKIVDFEPVCSGEYCPRYGICGWPHDAPPIGDPCIPWIRQQLEALRQKLKDTRMTIKRFKCEVINLRKTIEKIKSEGNHEGIIK